MFDLESQCVVNASSILYFSCAVYSKIMNLKTLMVVEPIFKVICGIVHLDVTT